MVYTLHLVADTLRLVATTVFHLLTANYFRQIQSYNLAPSTMKNILIIGGSYGGVSTAHRILKQATKLGSFKVTLVSPDTDFYWSMASPRGLIPGQLSDESLFLPIAPGFKKFSKNQFEFVLGTAERLDVEAQKVEISTSTGPSTLSYDFIILATGSKAKEDLPFKSLGSTEATKNALHDFQARLSAAKTVVIAGSGVTGVETAGELGFEYGGRKTIILLVANGSTVLEECPASVSKLALKELQNLRVQIKLQRKVLSSSELSNGQWELTLSDGEKVTADMYIPTFGLVPNSKYISPKYLNAGGYAEVNDFLKVKGTENVWAIGDLASVEPSQFITCDKQSTYVAKHITSILGNNKVVPYKAITSRFMGLQIGKKAGTGHYGNMRIPSFVIVWARKSLFTDNLTPTVTGSLF